MCMRVCFTFFLSFLLTVFLTGQNADDVIRTSEINIPFLEQLINTRINEHRLSVGLRALALDTTLNKSVHNHIDYLFQSDKLSPLQDNKELYSPQLRANYFGANKYIVDENVGIIYLNKKQRFRGKSKRKKKSYVNTTYNDIANDVLYRWLYKKKSRNKILHRYYNVCAVAVVYDDLREGFKVVQDYATVKWKYAFEEDSKIFAHSAYTAPEKRTSFEGLDQNLHSGRHVQKLQSTKNEVKDCANCVGLSEKVNANELPLLLQERKKSIRLYTEDLDLVRKLFKHRRDGLAIEIVKYTPYDCNNDDYYECPSRRNGQCVFSGNIQRPRYSRELFKKWRNQRKAFRRKKWLKVKTIIFEYRDGGDWLRKPRDIGRELKEKWEPRYWDYTIGKQLRNPNDYYEFNVVVIQKKKVCKILHFGKVCGETIEEFEDLPMLSDLNMSLYDIDTTAMGLNFTVPFEKGKFDYQYKDVRPLLDSLVLEDFTVLNAKVIAYSSIEGKAAFNEELLKKRVNSILSAMESVQNTKIEAKIETKEDWDHFSRIVLSQEQFNVFNGKSHEEIKRMIQNDVALRDLLEPYFEQERRADISFVIRYNFNDQTYGEYLYKRFEMHIDSTYGNRMLRLDHRDYAECLQTKFYESVGQGKIDTSWLFKLDIPAKRVFTRLLMNQYNIEKQYLGKSMDTIDWMEKHYETIKNLSKLRKIDPRVTYNHLNFLVKLWGEEPYDGAYSPRRMNKILTKLKTLTIPGADMKLLELNFTYKEANYYKNKSGRRNRERKNAAVQKIYEHYLTLKPSEALAVKYASYFSHFDMPKKAEEILMPFISEGKVSQICLQYYLKLKYKHPEEYPNSNYAQSLIEALPALGKEAWCDLFVGPCNISFQVFDDEHLRNVYCKECSEKKNFAEQEGAERYYIERE